VGKPVRLNIRTIEVRAYILYPPKKEDIGREREASFSALTKEQKDIDDLTNNKGLILRSYLRQLTIRKGTPRPRH